MWIGHEWRKWPEYVGKTITAAKVVFLIGINFLHQLVMTPIFAQTNDILKDISKYFAIKCYSTHVYRCPE